MRAPPSSCAPRFARRRLVHLARALLLSLLALVLTSVMLTGPGRFAPAAWPAAMHVS